MDGCPSSPWMEGEEWAARRWARERGREEWLDEGPCCFGMGREEEMARLAEAAEVRRKGSRLVKGVMRREGIGKVDRSGSQPRRVTRSLTEMFVVPSVRRGEEMRTRRRGSERRVRSISWKPPPSLAMWKG